MTSRPRRSRDAHRFRHLLWVDSGAALIAGVVVLSLSNLLSQLYLLPRELLVGMGAVNVAYGLYSGSLARQVQRAHALLLVLVVGNGVWATVCAFLAVRFSSTASPFGLAHLIGEALFVGALAGLEWYHRNQLTSHAATRLTRPSAL